MNTNHIDPASINVTARRHLIDNCYDLCEIALAHVGTDSGHGEIWAGKYGQVIVDDGGKAWIGDLCYMQEKFGWSHEDYMTAYGYDMKNPAWREAGSLTEDLAIHRFGDKFIMVIPTGSDGGGPLGLGYDTAACSFVTTERAGLEAARAACIEFLESKRAEIAAAMEEQARWFAIHEANRAKNEAIAKLWNTPGNTVIGTRSVAEYTGGGYRGRPRFKSAEEQVHFVIGRTSADFITSTDGIRYKRDTLKNCQVFTPRQIGARKAATTRKANRLALA